METRASGRSFCFEIRVIEGPDAGLTVTIDGSTHPRLIVGESPTCGLRLSDPRVSPRQLSLELVGDRLKLLNLGHDPRAFAATGTTRGTRVNGVLATEAMLAGGEVIRAGYSLLAVQRFACRLDALPAVTQFGGLRGESETMRRLFPIFASLARSSRPVLIAGERGVGKRLLAEELHCASRRNHEDAPFIVASRDLAGTELTQHLFSTGGLLEQAQGGTLFIEEIALLDRTAQRWLATELAAMPHTEESRRVRVIAATREPSSCRRNSGSVTALRNDLEEAFREPNGAWIELPPLRARHGDVSTLARIFWSVLGGVGGLPDDFSARFDRHPWPGNVRELRIAVLDRIRHADDASHGDWPLGAHARMRPSDMLGQIIERDLPFAQARDEVVGEFERRYIGRALRRNDKNVTRAAAASGISDRYFRVLKGARHRA